jgi:hypothetical protein
MDGAIKVEVTTTMIEGTNELKHVCVCGGGGGGGGAQIVEHDVGIFLSWRQLGRNRVAKDAPSAVDAIAKSGLEKGKCAMNAHDNSKYIRVSERLC